MSKSVSELIDQSIQAREAGNFSEGLRLLTLACKVGAQNCTKSINRIDKRIAEVNQNKIKRV